MSTWLSVWSVGYTPDGRWLLAYLVLPHGRLMVGYERRTIGRQSRMALLVNYCLEWSGLYSDIRHEVFTHRANTFSGAMNERYLYERSRDGRITL